MATSFTATDAAGYELTMGRWSRLLAKAFLAFAPVEGGARVLDVGSGTGSLTRALLDEVGEGGRVVGIDVADPYVAHARATVTDPRATFELADASSLAYGDGSFEAVRSILVLNFIPEHRATVADMLRVTKPGGTVAAAVWDILGGVMMMRLFWDVAVVLDPKAASFRDRTTAGPLTREGELRQVFVEAGALDVEERDVMIRMRFSSFEDYWTPLLTGQGTLGVYTSSLDEGGRERLQAALRDAYLSGHPDGPRSFVAVARAVKGRKA